MARGAAAQDRTDRRETIVATVKGMGCPFCVYGLQQHLLMLSGVKAAHVNLGKSQVIIDVVRGARLTNDQVARAVEKAGFSAGQVQRSAVFVSDPDASASNGH